MSDDPRASLKKGEYAAPLPTDLRTPCPIVNALANHGYLPRSGRGVTPEHIADGLSALGLGWSLNQLLTRGTFVEHPPNADETTGGGVLSGLRHPGQVDAAGKPVINLDQVGRHNAIEHDVSISRRDLAQGDNHALDAQLLQQFLAAAADGENLTTADWGRLRRTRYAQQKADNPRLDFGEQQQSVSFAEVALLQGVFGTGWDWKVPVKYMKALFGEGRLPRDEGWAGRWLGFGLLEFFALRSKVSAAASVPLDGRDGETQNPAK